MLLILNSTLSISFRTIHNLIILIIIFGYADDFEKKCERNKKIYSKCHNDINKVAPLDMGYRLKIMANVYLMFFFFFNFLIQRLRGIAYTLSCQSTNG